MDSNSEIAFDCTPRFITYKNGRIERLAPEIFAPPSQDPQNDVVSKDAVYSPEKNLSLRIYLPQRSKENEKKKKKLPVLVYFHGGGFIMESAFSETYHAFVTSVASAAECIAVSVDYRRAPEHPIPAAYEDSWEAIKWVFTHMEGSGPEHWLNEYADFSKVIVAGDSAGANISHHMVMRAGQEKLIQVSGMVLFHPYFWSKTPIDEYETKDVKMRKHLDRMWQTASPNSEKGVDDPWFNVAGSDSSSDLSGLGCGRVLVMVAGKDVFARQGLGYAAKLEKSGWGGKVEVMEAKDEVHVFHIRFPDTDNSRRVLQRFAEFLNEEVLEV